MAYIFIFFTRGSIRSLDLYTIIFFGGGGAPYIYTQNQPKPIDTVEQVEVCRYSPSQIISNFDFSTCIVFTMHLDILCLDA